ncbi:MAG: PASTA domain-containing protein, partial [Acidimicrobiales bacterium]
VISTNPPAGTMINPSQPVDLVVSSGPAKNPVPDVIGKTATQASNTLSGAGFKVKEQTQTVSDPNQYNTVIDQSPTANSPADPGSTVTITIGVPSSTTTSTSTTLPLGPPST